MNLKPIKNVLIIIPVYNDWLSLGRLLADLDRLFSTNPIQASVLAIDDGSNIPADPSVFCLTEHKKNLSLEILHLTRNIGHQRAIAIGLAYAYDHHNPKQIIIMDSDGEDRPDDVLSLIWAQQEQASDIIFARRSKRSESIVLRFFYILYKFLFYCLTGKVIAFGNFSSIPAENLKRVVNLSEIWNHYAAGIMRSNLKWQTIPTQRGKRYFGTSKMKFINLLIHGLSAISVYIDIVAARLILATTGLILINVIAFLAMIYIRYFTILAIPGWATTVAFGLALIMAQAIVFLTILAFVVLNNRSQKLFIPAKDYLDFIDYNERLITRD